LLTSQYTGVPPLAFLFAICILSLPSIRNRFYESFYAPHIVLVITYFGLLFWHSGNEMDSWAYLWATLAIWLASWLTRLFWKTKALSIRQAWFVPTPATITVAAGGAVTRIDVWPSASFAWSPGQHAFLHFHAIAPLDSHPFTIATAARPPAPTMASPASSPRTSPPPRPSSLTAPMAVYPAPCTRASTRWCC
jgi:predicted ferric reductase